MTETPNTVHGRLLEAVHISGYTFERACSELEWLLDEDRWKQIGNGFEDINDFLATIDFSEFRIAVEQRKKLATRLKEIEASQRATAKVLGVGVGTVNRDLGGVPSGTPKVQTAAETKAADPADVPSGTDRIDRSHFRRARPDGPASVEWYTPAPYLECARQVLGEFDLDPASSALAQEQVRARAYFTQADDGLAQEWSGRIWCNPPYCDAGKFVDKLLSELSEGRVSEAVLLVNAYCDTRWFHAAVKDCAAICFPLGRIYFEKPDGDQLRQPAYGSAFIYFGHQVDRFRAAFADRGVIMLPARAAP